jgi:small subunit ribosomal protein S8
MQDTTADMLTRIRNAVGNGQKRVKVLNSKLNRGVAQVLVDEGYIQGFDVIDDGRSGVLQLQLKYGPRGERLINSIDRFSKPGCRRFARVDDLPRPLQGLGVAIVSTSRGVLSDRSCREHRVGGEVVAIVT